MTRTFFLLIISIFLFSCQNKNAGINIETINVDFTNADKSFNLSNILEEQIKIVPLETVSDNIIGEVTDIHITSNKIFLADYASNRIYIFDHNGKYISQINRIGRGPQEYLEITCSTILNDSTIAIFDNLKRSINFYTSNGNFQASIDASKIWANDIVSMNKKLYLINNTSITESGCYYLFQTDMNGNNIQPALPFRKKIYDKDWGWSLSHYYTKFYNELALHFPPFDTIYFTTPQKSAPRFFVNFGRHKLPQDIIEGNGKEALIYSIKNNNYTKGIDRLLLSKHHMIIQARYKNEPYYTVYNRDSKQSNSYKTLDNHPFPQVPGSNMKAIDGKLIYWMDPHYFKAIFADDFNNESHNDDDMFASQIQYLLNTLNDSDNPVVFIQQFK